MGNTGSSAASFGKCGTCSQGGTYFFGASKSTSIMQRTERTDRTVRTDRTENNQFTENNEFTENNSDIENYYDYEYNYYESLTKKNTKLIKKKKKKD